jgi:hypothetical protein
VSVDATGNELTLGSSARRCGVGPAGSTASVVVVRVSDMVVPCVVRAPADARHGEQVNADAGETESLDPATSIWPETATTGHPFAQMSSQMSSLRSAHVAAAVREGTPIFVRMFAMWR